MTDEAKPSVANGATFRCAVWEVLKVVEHLCLLSVSPGWCWSCIRCSPSHFAHAWSAASGS